MIEINNVSKTFNHKNVLENINLNILPNKILGVIGNSGAGKSTLIRLISSLDTVSQGSINIPKDEKISMIFQNHALLQSKTVYKNVYLALKFTDIPKTEYKERILNILEYVGLTDKINAYPSQLSGGEKQRVGIARALVSNPSLLLCDEITSSLDPNSKKNILNLIEKINKEKNTTIVFVTHEMDSVQYICDNVAVLDDGKLIEYSSTEDLFLYSKNAIVKTFLKDIIYPPFPTNKEVENHTHTYYFLMNFEQYKNFQIKYNNGYVCEIKSLILKDKHFFSFYYVSFDVLGDEIPKSDYIQFERVNKNV